MTPSSTTTADTAAEAAARRLCPVAVRTVELAGRGGNNRLYRVTTQDGRVLALKSYPSRATDPRDRLGTEFSALSFVAGYDAPPRTPAAIARADEGFGLYQWIDGVPPGPPDPAGIDAMLAFIGWLSTVRDRPETAAMGLASEACLSIPQTAFQLRRRQRRLNEVAAEEPALADYMTGGFGPALDQALDRADRLYRAAGLDPEADLSHAHRILSPSDFGFHNAVRRPDGRLVFLDFEYFGWDDPVRLAGDVAWHPAMNLPDACAARFVEGCRRLFAGDPGFETRLMAQWPLLGLRWCAIILNEFLPERWVGRVHAGQSDDRRIVLDRQMVKARAFLERVDRSMRHFPYPAGDPL